MRKEVTVGPRLEPYRSLPSGPLAGEESTKDAKENWPQKQENKAVLKEEVIGDKCY